MLTAFAWRVDRRRTTGDDGRSAGESWLDGLCIGKLVLEVSSRPRSEAGDLLRVRWNRALSVNVLNEGFLDGERNGMGGFGDASRAAMIGSVLFMGKVYSTFGAGGSDSDTSMTGVLRWVPGPVVMLVMTDDWLGDCECLESDSVELIGALAFAGIGVSELFAALDDSDAVLRRIGSTLLADIARSKRGEEGSNSRDTLLGRGFSCLGCELGSCCCAGSDRDEECRECCCEDERVLVLGAVGRGFSGDFGVVEWLELLDCGSTMYLLP